MKKEVKYYLLMWILMFVLFQVIVFALPDSIVGPAETVFWIVYITVTLGFVGQLLCTLYYFSKENAKDYFLFFPIIKLSYSTLIACLLVGILSIVLKFLPIWFIIVSNLVFVVFYMLAIFKALTAAELISGIDKKVEETTSQIKELTIQMKALLEGCDERMKKSISKVYEEFRYSDPVSSAATAELESQIRFACTILSGAVYDNDEEEVKKQAEKICNMLKSRNELCKIKK